MTTVLPDLLVGMGGFLGANRRFINISGSFLLGVVGTLVAAKMWLT